MPRSKYRSSVWLNVFTAVAASLVVLPWVVSFGPVTGEKAGLAAAVIATLVPGGMLLFARRNSGTSARLRQALGFMAMAILLISAGNFLRLLAAYGVSFPTIPGLDLASNLVLWAIGFTALVRIPLAPVVPGTRWRIATDTAIAGLGMAVALFVVWTLPGLRQAPIWVRQQTMAFNAMAAANLFILTRIAVRGAGRRFRWAVCCLSATVVVDTVYLVAFQYGIGTRSYDGRLTNSLFFLDYLFFLHAAAQFHKATHTGAQAAPEKPTLWVVNPLPVSAVAGVGALLIVSAVRGTNEAIIPLSVAIVAMAILLMARSVASNLESVRAVQERAKRERRVQAEKSELIKRLSGGIAQIINNMMTVVHGHAELLRLDCPPDSLTRSSLDAISSAAYRVSGLAGRLELASGQRRSDERPTRLGEAVLLQRESVNLMVGQKRDVIWDLTGADGSALVARSDMETIIRELVSNAGEATFHGGKITIRILDEVLPHLPSGISPCPPGGLFSVLEVADTGRGIPESDIPHVVEPFFTSRPVLEGRGLGLSIVHGIVASYGGGLLIDTVPGSGSRVRVYLPVTEAA